QAGGERLDPLVESGMRDQIEAGQHGGIRDLAVRLEIVGDAASQHWPIGDANTSARPAVVSRVDPSVPERERDMQAGELRRRPGRELVLHAVEAAADRVITLGLMVERVLAQFLDERVARLFVCEHSQVYVGRGARSR